MPAVAGPEVDGISFTEISLVDRPEHAAVLGRVFTSWSLIEAAAAGLLGLMMHADHRAALAILATFTNNKSRVNAIRKVGKVMLNATLQKEFDQLMKDVLAYAEERNAIAHNLWGVHKDEADVVYRMPMTAISNFVVEAPHKTQHDPEQFVTSLKSQMERFTPADLEQVEQKGRDLLHRVMVQTTNAFSRSIEKQNAPAG